MTTSPLTSKKKTPVSGTEDPITKEALDKAVDNLSAIIKKFGKPIWTVVFAVILALILAFVSVLVNSYQLVIDSNRDKRDSFNNMSAKIDTFLNEKKTLEEAALQKQILQLQQQVINLQTENNAR